VTQRAAFVPPQADQPQTGFTLIEVMLAMTIFALMSTVLYGAFALSHSAVEKSQRSFERNQKLRAVDELVGSYIRSAYPYRSSPQGAPIFFTGEQADLTFVSSFSIAMGGRGMAKVHLFWEGDKNRAGVLRLEEETPVRILSEEENEGHQGVSNGLVVREGVKAFRITYLDPQSDEEKWEERWDAREKNVLPRAVRLNYLTEEGREVQWVFPVMINLLAQRP
jgi:prepilin-type N-terminal cleavage/methylation domain-containing protein